MPDGETISQLNYGLFKKLFSRAPSHLTNQVFLMLYGSFEAYIADLVLDGLTHQDTKDPYQEALHLMVLAKWRGKIDRIGQKLNVGLGKLRFVAKFRDMELEFWGSSSKTRWNSWKGRGVYVICSSVQAGEWMRRSPVNTRKPICEPGTRSLYRLTSRLHCIYFWFI